MRSWPACVCTSEAYFAGCCSALMWSILILMPVSLVKRWPISDSFLSESGAKLFQHRYETSRCWPRAGGTPVARTPARPVPAVVVRKRRRVIVAMIPSLSFGSTGRPCQGGGPGSSPAISHVRGECSSNITSSLGISTTRWGVRGGRPTPDTGGRISFGRHHTPTPHVGLGA